MDSFESLKKRKAIKKKPKATVKTPKALQLEVFEESKAVRPSWLNPLDNSYCSVIPGIRQVSVLYALDIPWRRHEI